MCISRIHPYRCRPAIHQPHILCLYQGLSPCLYPGPFSTCRRNRSPPYSIALDIPVEMLRGVTSPLVIGFISYACIIICTLAPHSTQTSSKEPQLGIINIFNQPDPELPFYRLILLSLLELYIRLPLRSFSLAHAPRSISRIVNPFFPAASH